MGNMRDVLVRPPPRRGHVKYRGYDDIVKHKALHSEPVYGASTTAAAASTTAAAASMTAAAAPMSGVSRSVPEPDNVFYTSTNSEFSEEKTAIEHDSMNLDNFLSRVPATSSVWIRKSTRTEDASDRAR